MPEPVELTDSTFSQVNDRALALVDFWAEWCGFCRMAAPILEELAAEYSDRVFFGKLNVEENLGTVEKFRTFSLPTFILFKDGVEVERIVGCVPKEHLVAALKRHGL